MAGQSSMSATGVASLESHDFELPDDTYDGTDQEILDGEIALEAAFNQMNTITRRICSLEALADTIDSGDVVSPQQAMLMEQIAEEAVEDTDMDANVDVIPGLEAYVVGQPLVLSTEGIKETISKLVTSAKKTLKDIGANILKIMGSVRAKGYLIRERLKGVSDKVAAGTIDLEAASIELKGLAATLTADKNVPNDAAELIKFLKGQITIAESITVKCIAIHSDLMKGSRAAIKKYSDEKGQVRNATILLSKSLDKAIKSMPKNLTSHTGNTKFKRIFGTRPDVHSDTIGGEYVITSNFAEVSDYYDMLNKDDASYASYLGAIHKITSNVQSLRKPDKAFKTSKVKPFTKAEFTKVMDTILTLVDTLLKVYDWSEKETHEFEAMLTDYFDMSYRFSDGNSLFDYKRFQSALMATDGVLAGFMRGGIVRLMEVANVATKLTERVCDLTVKVDTQ